MKMYLVFIYLFKNNLLILENIVVGIGDNILKKRGNFFSFVEFI